MSYGPNDPAVARYIYTNPSGEPIAEKRRYPGKKFQWWHLNGSGWASGKPENGGVLLYRLHEIVKCNVAFIVEGEKDADRLTAIDWGHVASDVVVGCTTAPDGANTWQVEEYGPYFTGKRTYIIPDADAAGAKYAKDVTRSVLKYAAEVRVVRLPPDTKDVSEFLDHRTVDDLAKLIQAAPLVEINGKTAVWPEPESLESELTPVPPFNLEWLPQSLSPMVGDVAERMQVPVDFPAVTAIALLGGICGRRVMMQPKAKDTSWLVVPNLWGAIIGRPGLLKTPAMSAMTASVHAIETEWRKEDDAKKDAFEIAKRKAKIDEEAWETRYKEAKKKGTTLPADPPKCDLDLPPARRLVTSDATPEKLHEMLKENPAGILVLRDELTGWLAGMEKQGRETERTFALEAWDGNSHFTLDRIGRGSVYVDRLCVAYFGGIQPARLSVYMSGPLEETPDDDGLMQRFQLLTWPDPPPSWKYVDREPDEKMIRRAAEVYRRIAEMNATTPRILTFSPDAQHFFVTWLTKLEKRLRSDDNLSPAFQSHLAKYRKLMPALALLFALADASLTGVGRLQAVELDYAQKAAEVCDYLESHAVRVYAARVRPEIDAAHILSKRLLTGKLGEQFTLRDVYRPQWTGLTTADEARAACAVLEEANWIRRQESDPGGQGGRPPEVYEINPKIRDD
jgi:hypothetical protein